LGIAIFIASFLAVSFAGISPIMVVVISSTLGILTKIARTDVK
jgi:hypothetical protein